MVGGSASGNGRYSAYRVVARACFNRSYRFGVLSQSSPDPLLRARSVTRAQTRTHESRQPISVVRCAWRSTKIGQYEYVVEYATYNTGELSASLPLLAQEDP